MMSYLLAVWHDVADTWSLFANGWWAAWLVAICLALPGVLVVARNQIFIGAAVAQSSTAGMAAGFWIAGLMAGLGKPVDPCASHAAWSMAQMVPFIAAGVAAVLAALVCAPSPREGRGSPESRTGWIFLVASALGIVLLTRSAHGTREVERLIASSVLGATTFDVVLLALLAVITVLVVILTRRRLVVLAIDPGWSPLADMRRGPWEAGLAMWVGLATASAIHSVGLLFAFACLILPALAARAACREVWTQFIVAPILAVIGTSIGFAFATHHDLPLPQVAVVCLAGLPVLAAPLAWWHRR
jgi:ABC-type Mn2+/Zn2+ transport system permease subunit